MNPPPVEPGGFSAFLERFGPQVTQFVQQALDQWVLSLIWLGLFCVTFLLMRMLVTRWGESQVTMKAVALSLLVHAVLGLWTTTVRIARESFAHQDGGPIAIRRVVVEGKGGGDPAGQGGTSSQRLGKIGERGFPVAATEVSRVERSQSVPPAMDIPKTELPALPATAVKLPDLPSLWNQINTVPTTLRNALSAPKTAEGSRATINEETATARPEAVLADSAPVRQTRPTADAPTTDVVRPARPAEEKPTDVVTAPTVQEPVTTTVPAPSVQRESSEPSPATRATSAPANLPAANIGNNSRPADNPAVKGVASSSPFTRSGRGGPAGVEATGEAERLRQNTTPAGTGGDPNPGAMIASRPGAPDALPSDVLSPNLFRPDDSGTGNRTGIRVPATYRLRNLPQRNRVAVEMGATEDSERAVEMSLQWLARHQNIQGFWDPDGFTAYCPAGDRCTALAALARDPTDPNNPDHNSSERQRSGMDADSGMTGLAILAFLGAGYTHEEGTYADHLDRALRWLIRQQKADGYLGGKAGRYASIYCHGMATIAIGEAYGMTNDPTLREPLARAVQYIVAVQNTGEGDGGWRYVKGQREGDVSIFGWQLMALKSAATAGLEIPSDSWDAAINFLKQAGLGKFGGLAAYRKGDPIKPSMTAEALFSRQILGMKRTNPASVEAVEYLSKNLPRRSSHDLYYWYYGTLAMYHYGGEPWKQWNDALRDTLVSEQRTDGHAAGSWDPRTPWGDYGGRVFSTAVSTLCLEVYYRFLPLHQVGENEMPSDGK